MKEFLKKIGNAIKFVYGYAIMICLFAGGATFFGYLVAFFVGGATATAICTVIYTKVFPIIIYVSTISMLLGLIAMYLCGETALTTKKNKKK